MDYFEAMQALKLGKRVRITTWPKDQWVGLKSESYTFCGEQKVKHTPMIQSGAQWLSPVSMVAALEASWELWVDPNAVPALPVAPLRKRRTRAEMEALRAAKD